MPVKSFTPLLCVHARSPWASTFPNGRHFEGLKHLWIYIYIYLYIFSYTNKQLDSKVRSLIERERKKRTKSEEKENEETTWCGHDGGDGGWGSKRMDGGSRNTVSLWVFQYSSVPLGAMWQKRTTEMGRRGWRRTTKRIGGRKRRGGDVEGWTASRGTMWLLHLLHITVQLKKGNFTNPPDKTHASL